jgi:hypothetical protein
VGGAAMYLSQSYSERETQEIVHNSLLEHSKRAAILPTLVYLWEYRDNSLTFKCAYSRLELIKGTVAPVWVWLKVVWLEREKIGKEPLSILKIVHSSFDF